MLRISGAINKRKPSSCLRRKAGKLKRNDLLRLSSEIGSGTNSAHFHNFGYTWKFAKYSVPKICAKHSGTVRGLSGTDAGTSSVCVCVCGSHLMIDRWDYFEEKDSEFPNRRDCGQSSISGWHFIVLGSVSISFPH